MLDLQQCEGFQTSLPLCRSRIDAARLLTLKQAASLIPTGMQEAVRQNGLYAGLNAVNDALILLNRKNSVNRGGLITGTKGSGKTYQNKREIVNALIGSKDRITVVTMGDGYDRFAEKLGGAVRTLPAFDLFAMEEGYSLTDSDLTFKSCFLAAAVSALQGFPEGMTAEEIAEKDNSISEETRKLLRVMEAEHLSGDEAGSYVLKMRKEYPFTADAIAALRGKRRADAGTEAAAENVRLTVYKAGSSAELILMLDFLWNRAIRDKKQNVSNWIFLDPADLLFSRGSFSAYLAAYLHYASLFQTPFTMVADRAAELLAETRSAVAFENAALSCGYVKLLNQGPKERRQLAEFLSIPQALLPYISNTEPGKGVILTPGGNIPFTDNYLELYQDTGFQDLFL